MSESITASCVEMTTIPQQNIPQPQSQPQFINLTSSPTSNTNQSSGAPCQLKTEPLSNAQSVIKSHINYSSHFIVPNNQNANCPNGKPRQPKGGQHLTGKNGLPSPLGVTKQSANNSNLPSIRLGSKPSCAANHIPSDPQQICRVCEGRASGLHFGEYTCESCKLFFLRQTKTDNACQKAVCPLSWNCDINHKVKSKCRACRFKKCCEVGMSKERVVYGRNARAKPLLASPQSPGFQGDHKTHGGKKSMMSSPAMRRGPNTGGGGSPTYGGKFQTAPSAVPVGHPNGNRHDRSNFVDELIMPEQALLQQQQLQMDSVRQQKMLMTTPTTSTAGPPNSGSSAGTTVNHNHMALQPLHPQQPVNFTTFEGNHNPTSQDLYGNCSGDQQSMFANVKMEAQPLLGPNATDFCKVAADAASRSSGSSPTYSYGNASPVLNHSQSNPGSNPASNSQSPHGSGSGSPTSHGSGGSSLQDQISSTQASVIMETRMLQSDTSSNSSSSENVHDQCWSVLTAPSEEVTTGAQRSMTANGSLPDLSFEQFGNLPHIAHINSRNSYFSNHFIVQRAVMNTLGHHFSTAANGAAGSLSHHGFMNNCSDSFQNRVDASPNYGYKSASSSAANSSGESSSSSSYQSGNSSGSESDDRSVEFTGPDGLGGPGRNNLPSHHRLPFSMHPNDASVSELWLELPNLEFVCKYCFLSPCYCFGDRKL